MITWNTDCNAPCCPGEIVNDDGRTILIQTDWDYPGTASTFGWSTREVQNTPHYCCNEDQPCDDSECDECNAGRKRAAEYAQCDHPHTDGTVDCDLCGCKVDQFIASARDWLDSNDGATVDDPGYFS